MQATERERGACKAAASLVSLWYTKEKGVHKLSFLQQATHWISETFSNLACSILKKNHY